LPSLDSLLIFIKDEKTRFFLIFIYEIKPIPEIFQCNESPLLKGLPSLPFAANKFATTISSGINFQQRASAFQPDTVLPDFQNPNTLHYFSHTVKLAVNNGHRRLPVKKHSIQL
jgi:hypothetical protein